MTTRKQFAITIPAITLLVVLAVFFAFLVGAKYTEERRGFTQFDVASFNAIILGNNTLDELRNGTMYEFGTEYGTDNFPGMVEKEIPFTISNGIAFTKDETSGSETTKVVTGDNASDTTIEYTIRLLTTGNMPISFKLVKMKSDGTEEKRYITEFLESTYLDENLKSTDTQTFETSSNGTKWNTYRFMTEESGGLKSEATFELIGGELNLNSYKLLLDWPIEAAETDAAGNVLTKATNSQDYRKEFDNLQLLVTVKSKDQTKDIEIPVDPSTMTYDDHANGIIIAAPDLSETQEYDETNKIYTYDHTIDLRAFKRESTATATDLGTYEFQVNNGVNIGYASLYPVDYDEENHEYIKPYQFTYYTVQVMFPAEEMAGYDYNMSIKDDNDIDGDGNKEEYIPLYVIPDDTEYWTINDVTGEVEKKSKTLVVETEDDDPKGIYRTFRVDTLAWTPEDVSCTYLMERGAFEIASDSLYKDSSAVFRVNNVVENADTNEYETKSAITTFRMQLISVDESVRKPIYDTTLKADDDAENAILTTLNQVKPWQFAFLNKFTVRINAVYTDVSSFTGNKVDLFKDSTSTQGDSGDLGSGSGPGD